MTMMGGPIDARKSPTPSTTRDEQEPRVVRAHVIYRVPINYPGSGRRVYRLPAAHRLRAMNPDRPPEFAHDYFSTSFAAMTKRDSHRKFYDEYNAVLDMPAVTTSTTIRSCSRLRARQRHGKSRVARASQDIETTAPADLEANSTTSPAPVKPRCACLCTGIPKDRQSTTTSKAPSLRIFSGRRLGEKVYPQVVTSSPDIKTATSANQEVEPPKVPPERPNPPPQDSVGLTRIHTRNWLRAWR